MKKVWTQDPTDINCNLGWVKSFKNYLVLGRNSEKLKQNVTSAYEFVRNFESSILRIDEYLTNKIKVWMNCNITEKFNQKFSRIL
jgi:hypothetical protein